jgi:hypothetical protein
MGDRMGFWCPVGPHAGESLGETFDRKSSDIKKYGYTLWSFSPSSMNRISAWRRQLENAVEDVAVFGCGDVVTNSGSDSTAIWASDFSADGKLWEKVACDKMTSYHRRHTAAGILASAFYVVGIDYFADRMVSTPSKWFRTNDETWRNASLPSRGQFLTILPEGFSDSGRRLRVVMRIKSPYVVLIR